MRRLLLSVLFVALGLAACGGSSEEIDFTDTPSLIRITSGTGNISVAASDAGATVLGEARGSTPDPAWTAEMSGSELVVADGCAASTDCTVDLTITVAGTADVVIENAAGSITIVDMNSSLSVSGAADNVLLNGITGPIDVALTKGDMLGARLVSPQASFHTDDGTIDVTLTEVFESLTVTSGRGDVTAQVPGGGYNIDAASDDGAVEVNVDHLPGAASSIVITTGKGDVTVYRK